MMFSSQPSDIESTYWTMRQNGKYWIPQTDGPPMHIDTWYEREKLRLEYERQREDIGRVK